MASELKEMQNEMLSILEKIDEICSANNIKYMLSWGTALGAVRHKGFIPWDNDIDISMPYKDYIRFMEIWKKNKLDDTTDYFWQSYKTEKKYPLLFAKIRSKKVDAKEASLEGLGIKEGVWVDIFPAFGISNNPKIERMQRKLMKLANFICHKHYFLNGNEFVKKHHDNLKKKQRLLKMIPDCVCRMLISMLLFSVMNIDEKKCEYLGESGIAGQIYKNKKKYYTKLQYMEFEGKQFLVTGSYDEYLTDWYGDYMTPVKYNHVLL